MNLNCWKREIDPSTDEAVWTETEAPRWLISQGNRMLIELPGAWHATVNGLEVVGRLQVVEPGDLVRVRDDEENETELLLADGGAVAVDGAGRTCGFSGEPIAGEAIRCLCGQVFCRSVLEVVTSCPDCGSSLESRSRPPENML